MARQSCSGNFAVKLQLDCPITVCFEENCKASLFPFTRNTILSSSGQLLLLILQVSSQISLP